MTALSELPVPVLVGLGGALGALARYGVDRALSGGRRSTFAVNVLGSVALGALLATPASPSGVALLGTGVCGAFTTFSSFAVGVAEAVTEENRWPALRYATGTLVAALAGVALGGALVGGI